MNRRLDFEPELASLRKVRLFLRNTTGVAVDHPAVLVASELAANAVLHAGTPFGVNLEVDEELRIEVCDEAGHTAVDRNDGDGWGFGLRLVDAFSEDWDVVRDGPRKTIWARVRM